MRMPRVAVTFMHGYRNGSSMSYTIAGLLLAWSEILCNVAAGRPGELAA